MKFHLESSVLGFLFGIMVALAFFLFCTLESVEFECHEVRDVLSCGNKECRVLLDNYHRATVFDVVVPGDKVRIRTDFYSGEIDHQRCP